MILSEQHKFVFIKGMKVAGTSVEMALSTLCGPDDIVTPISPFDERERLAMGGQCQNYAGDRAVEADYLKRLKAAQPSELAAVLHPPLVYYNHMPLTEVMQRYGKPLSGFHIVCIERSPYAKAISWANMRLTYGSYRVGGEMRADPEALKAYVDRGFETGAIRDCRNIDRYRGPDGTVLAQPMRYASLQADFDAFVRSLGVTAVPPLPHAKKGLLSDSLNPRDVLRPDQIARIDTLFADEFEAFGFPRT
jgi:hypothetical protein